MLTPRWQYSVVDLSDRDGAETEEYLDQLGQMGWELVNITSTITLDGYVTITAYMKRPYREYFGDMSPHVCEHDPV